jgi:transposase
VGKKLVVGVDVAKGSFAVSLFDGERFRDFSLSSSPEEFLERVAPHLPEDPGEVFFVMEATGVYHFNLALFLRKKGYSVSVVNPFVVKKFAEMLQKRAKTDSVDARTLAQFGFFASPPPLSPKMRRPTSSRKSRRASRATRKGEPRFSITWRHSATVPSTTPNFKSSTRRNSKESRRL